MGEKLKNVDSKKERRGQDYKRFSSMSRCSTHNLCSEMTLLRIVQHGEFDICFESSLCFSLQSWPQDMCGNNERDKNREAKLIWLGRVKRKTEEGVIKSTPEDKKIKTGSGEMLDRAT